MRVGVSVGDCVTVRVGMTAVPVGIAGALAVEQATNKSMEKKRKYFLMQRIIALRAQGPILARL